MTVVLFSLPFVAARIRPAVKQEIAGPMARVTKPLASLTLSLRYLSLLSNPALLRPYALDDGGITSGTRVISVGVRILVIVSSSFTLPESDTTQIYLQATPALARTNTRTRNFRIRAEPHSLPSH